MTEIKEYVTDAAALLVVGTVLYQSVVLTQVSDELKTLVGAAAAYLFIKYSPNTV